MLEALSNISLNIYVQLVHIMQNI